MGEHVRPIAGLGQGLSAFLVGYVVVGGLLFVEAAVAGTSLSFGGLVTGSLSGLLATHLGAVTGGTFLSNADLLAIPVVVYYLVPVALLGYSGRAIAKRADLPTPQAAVAAGASTTVGYAVGVVFFLPLLSAVLQTLADVLGAPTLAVPVSYAGDFVRVLLVAGLFYPVVFGGLGGYLVFRRRARDRQATPA